jgi:hypothetical protein
MTAPTGDSVTRLTDEQARVIATSGMSQDPTAFLGRRTFSGDDLWPSYPTEAEDNEANKAWRESDEAKRSRTNRRYLLIACFGTITITACATFALAVFVRASWRDWSPALFTGLVISIFLGWFWLLATRVGNMSRHLFVVSYLDLKRTSPPRQERVPKVWLRDPDLQNLIILNRAQIGVYQDIATGDAKRAARNSQIAMSFGFLMLIAGAALAIKVPSATSKVVVGALASLGSVLSGYIGQTFLKAQTQATNQLNYYFRQPLVTSYMLAVERLAQKLPPGSARENALKDLIKNILVAANHAEELDSDQPIKSRRRNRPSSTTESSSNNETQQDV